MPRTAARGTQADLARAIRAAEKSGARHWSVEWQPDGSIVIRGGESPEKMRDVRAAAQKPAAPGDPDFFVL